MATQSGTHRFHDSISALDSDQWDEQLKNESGLTLSAEFWSDFLTHCWKKTPHVIAQPFIKAFVTPAEIFSGLVEAGDQCRAGDRIFPLGFYFENALLLADVGRHVPASSDESIAGYAERVTRKLAGRHFGLIVEEFQTHSAPLWLRVREFLRGLYQFTGLPGDNAKATVFLGNYEKTPLGLHQGSSDNFMFVIAGRKRLRVWPEQFFRDREAVEHTLEYEQFLDGSIVLEGKPGDILYWPAGYWHIGESLGELSVGLSVALFMEAQPATDILKHTARKVEERLERVDHSDAFLFHPQRLKESAKTIRNLTELSTTVLKKMSDDPSLEQALNVSWLNRVTGFGFTNVPAAVPRRRLDDKEVVQSDPHYPIIWMPARENDLICSANGHAFSIAAHPSVIMLLEHLNTGASCRVQSLIDKYSGTIDVGDVEFEATHEEVRALLEKLYCLRALTVCS